ncbi:MAG TPA: Smr/MutS family protein [Vicinamibacteria bacterium]|nr:Smr/MutS family protein [Vicinamibacteria bacterium]
MPRARSHGYRPFMVLEKLVASGDIELAPDTDKLVAPPRKLSPSLSDEEAFEAGMEGVRPLGWSETPLSLPVPFEIPRRSSGEAEALAELAAFVDGQGEMDPFATGEGIEGASSRRGRLYLPRLKRGDFSVQDHLDLHGLDLVEAKRVLERFLRRARHLGQSCVRVVHGRGTHSDSEPSLMKRELTRWLSSRRLSRTVVAFASARWKDGGSGAVYVLLYGKWRPPR